MNIVESFISVPGDHDPQIKSIAIFGRRWFQKTCGNTYHSVQIFVNTMEIKLPYQYGYGEQYYWTAINYLVKNGYIIQENNESVREWAIRNKVNLVSAVVDVARKKDL